MTKYKKNKKQYVNMKALRPDIKVSLEKLEKVLLALIVIILAITWIYVMISFLKLPSKIPTEFNDKGIAIAFGDKDSIFAMPVVSTIVVIILLLMARKPKYFNYQVKVTKENALRLYRNTIDLTLIIAIEILLTFNYLEYKVIEESKGIKLGVGNHFLIIFIIIIFLTILYFTRRVRKLA